ncbi:MAG: UDP-N-acetylmuramoyl-L-alanyl-D-glutamate--2,6-diaminopimelate ligase [Candidatus Zixiibacteriota bacterium]
MIKDLPQAAPTGDLDVEIDALEHDSRLVRPNTLFFAVAGFQHDGYDFVSEAKANGAVAVMGERGHCGDIATHVQVTDVRRAMAAISARFYHCPSSRLNVTGVTGTNGKTTVCHLIRSILQTAGRPTGLITSLVYDTGRETFPAERTTPESLDLQRLLYLMTQHDCTDAVMEVSSHALELKRVDHTNFLVAVFTNLTRDHLDFHKTMDAYLQAKTLLLDKLDDEAGCAVINLDVPEFRGFFGREHLSYVTYSASDRSAHVHCPSVHLRSDHTTFDLATPIGNETVTMHLPGRYNLVNALAAAAAGMALGVDLDAIVSGLENAEPVPGRFNVVNVGQPFTIIVDYAHTPDAITRLCQSAREISKGRLLLLFGCGGNRDRGKRPLMGEAAVMNSDLAILTSDNPRDENPEAIIKDAEAGMSGGNYRVHLDRREAIRALLKEAKAGDIVILAGKGAEKYQEIKGVRHPFDDNGEAQAALSELGFGSTTTGTGN